MSNLTFGTAAAQTELLINPRSAFSATLRRKVADWSDPPVVEFFGPDADLDDPGVEPIATWTAIVNPEDPKQAVWTEVRATARERSHGEQYVVRDAATDEVVATGRVSKQ